jgi:hypothetical protein
LWSGNLNFDIIDINIKIKKIQNIL